MDNTKAAHPRGFGLARAALLTLMIAAGSVLCPLPSMASDAQGIVDEEGVQVIDPHDFEMKSYCVKCHDPEPPMLRFDAVTTCTKCHPNVVGDHPVARHPLGKMPRISIPVSLPLTDDGLMVCFTCHEPHNKTNYSKMLRVDYFKLCAACHKGY
ncbi:MAG: cytochrome c3 family protein [Deltaproteobacteria bacterium]